MLLQDQNILSDEDFRKVSAAVRCHCGINLNDGKRELVRGRLAKRLRAGGFKDSSKYLQNVLANPRGNEFLNLVDFLSTNLTGFFREPVHFEYLRTNYLNEFVQRGERRSLRAWSAGCSSGQEPYSLAIVLNEFLGAHDGYNALNSASDISRQMLRTAREGDYEFADVEHLPALMLKKYFTQEITAGHKSARVIDSLRRLVRFRYLNLVDNFPFNGTFDFIFCRNVMIYFDKPTQEKVVNRIWDHLEPGGLLFTGHAESLTGISHGFRYVQPTIYVKPRESAAATLVVNMSDAKISNDPRASLATYSLGSCIAVCVYDPTIQLGGLLHYQLPSAALDSDRAKLNPMMYADTGMAWLLEKVIAQGAQTKRLQIKLVGAAAMIDDGGVFNIGRRNHAAARKLIWQQGLFIDGEDVGGTNPRNVSLRIADGSVTVKAGNKIIAL